MCCSADRWEAGTTAPILSPTARDAVDSRTAGLDAGADDYLLKPFDFGELLARLRALCRDTPLPLTTREYALLEFMARRAGRVVTRTDIAEHVWDSSYDPMSNIVALVVGAVHERPGLARLDTDLTDAMRSAAGVVNSEIDERHQLAAGAREAMYELELPGVGVSVLDQSARLLATRHDGVPALDFERQKSLVIADPPRTLEPEKVRVAASRWQHRSESYTIVAWTALAPLDRDHATVMNTIRIAIPVGALAAVAGGWLMVWRALGQLSQMAALADAIDPRHLDARLQRRHRTAC